MYLVLADVTIYKFTVCIIMIMCCIFVQQRNLYNKMFGGFLMRAAYELGWTNATVYRLEANNSLTELLQLTTLTYNFCKQEMYTRVGRLKRDYEKNQLIMPSYKVLLLLNLILTPFTLFGL